MQRLRKEGSLDAEMVARSKEDEVKMLGVGVAKRLEKVRYIKGPLENRKVATWCKRGKPTHNKPLVLSPVVSSLGRAPQPQVCHVDILST